MKTPYTIRKTGRTLNRARLLLWWQVVRLGLYAMGARDFSLNRAELERRLDERWGIDTKPHAHFMRVVETLSLFSYTVGKDHLVVDKKMIEKVLDARAELAPLLPIGGKCSVTFGDVVLGETTVERTDR